MTRKAQRKATEVFYETADSARNPQKTFHIFGVNRGGTTSVAGIVAKLGVPIGDEMGNNLEDLRFYGVNRLPQMPESIADSNARHDVWGWKFPHSIEYLGQILPNIRNLRLILVTRDATAVYLGMQSRNDADPDKAAFMAFNRSRRNLDFVRQKKLPTLFVSYEKLLAFPQECVREIADFVGVDVGPDLMRQCLEWIEPGSYKSRARHF